MPWLGGRKRVFAAPDRGSRLLDTGEVRASLPARYRLGVVAAVAVGLAGIVHIHAQVSIFVSYADAKPMLESLLDDLLPVELRGRTSSERESMWPAWIARRDAAIRARVAEGDEDSVINLLLYGTSFTKQRPVSEQDVAGLLVRGDAAGGQLFVASPLLTARIGDFVAWLAAPASGADDRRRFARDVIARAGIDLSRGTGQADARRYLENRAAVVGRAERAERLLAPGTDLPDRLTIFRDRGLATDTSVSADFGIDAALGAMRTAGAIRPGTVRRVAVIGPGLDVADKQFGYDFYPPQTVQPFAVIDSLRRLGLAAADGVRVTAFDVSPRVLTHIESARERARVGAAYVLVMPRSLDRPWTPQLTDYWRRVGSEIGGNASNVPQAPANAGRVDVRGVSVRPDVVLSVFPANLNIVTERPAAADENAFDLVIATNILLYYGVFEQSLASSNIARLLRPGGVLLTNNRIFEVPGSPLTGVGYTDVVYTTLPGVGEAGDRVIWYREQ